jgi:hypothetical protein
MSLHSSLVEISVVERKVVDGLSFPYVVHVLQNEWLPTYLPVVICIQELFVSQNLDMKDIVNSSWKPVNIF